MIVRKASSQRREMLQRAREIAAERAVRWRVWLGDRDGEPLAAWKVVEAKSAAAAMKKVKRARGAEPLLSTREWRAIYEEARRAG